MFSIMCRIPTRVRSPVVSALALLASTQASSQQTGGFYKERFDRVRSITQLMINDLANATLNSACLSAANFKRVTASLDAETKLIAMRMREEGIKVLNETKAWKTCKSQSEQIARLATDMSGATAWSAARANAKRSAFLTIDEEFENDLLVDRKTKTPITSSARSVFPVNLDTLLSSRDGARATFEAILVVSEEGMVTACKVTSSIGNNNVDISICRKAQSFLRYRPAFDKGRIVPSTTHLRVSVAD